MAHYFIRVELQGNPSGEDYTKLHDHMLKNNWYRSISGSAGTSALPHAMYQGNATMDVSALTKALHDGIKGAVWTHPIVLVISSITWSMKPPNLV